MKKLLNKISRVFFGMGMFALALPEFVYADVVSPTIFPEDGALFVIVAIVIVAGVLFFMATKDRGAETNDEGADAGVAFINALGAKEDKEDKEEKKENE